MPRRIVIALIAVVAIGVGAYVLSPPKKGTVEWHKREYLALRYPKPPLKERIRDNWDRFRGRGFFRCDIGFDYMAAEGHLRASEELGYLEPQFVVLTNVPVDDALNRLNDAATTAIREGIWKVHGAGPHELFVIRPREDREIWDRLIRAADVPEGGKTPLRE